MSLKKTFTGRSSLGKRRENERRINEQQPSIISGGVQ